MQKMRRIGISVDLVGSYGRGVFLGIRKYAEEVCNWQCKFCSTWLGGNDIDVSDWDVDGWIGYGTEGGLITALRSRPRPLVVVSSHPLSGSPTVAVNNTAVAQMGFDYLLDRGHTNFAFVGYGHGSPFSERRASFTRAVEEYGRPCHAFPEELYPPRASKELRRWLAKLPKPVGVLTDHDHIGAVVLDCCRDEGLAVPEAIAVLSVDNDELYCTARFPMLSSIQLNTFRIGYEAAATLDRLLNGETPPTKALLVPPLHVVTRHSTNALVFADEEVRRAVSFIHSRMTHPTTASDVIQNAIVSGATLEARFRRQLKSSILRYIHRVHVEHAKSLLTDTDMPIAEVARASGFTSRTRMGIVFQQIAGRTPSEHRKQAKSVPQLHAALDLPSPRRSTRA